VRRRLHVLRAAALVLALVVAVGVAALAVVLALGRVPDHDLGPVLVVGTLAAAGFAALRPRLDAAATQVVHGDRPPPEDVVRSFADRAARGVPEDELLLQLVESMRRTLRLRGAELWTVADGNLTRVAATPARPVAGVAIAEAERRVLTTSSVVGRAWLELWVPALLEGRAAEVRVAPATHAGALLGVLVAERDAGDAPFTTADDLALADLGRRLGVVLHNRRLDRALQSTLDDLRRTNAELTASRARLVAAADAERRRIERDLHDGAQQHLVALAVNLRLARDLVGEDTAAAEELLVRLGDDVRDAIGQVRALAHGIYPPLLVDAGLGEALRAVAARTPQAVTVDAVVGRHAPDVEAAVYFCCLEALQNAAKHAPDASVTVRVWEDGAVRFEVVDDGPGFDPATVRAGHGFQNMGDRLGAIGGSVAWESTPGGGTRVRGGV
jgi:signal transduction histidine kinase